MHFLHSGTFLKSNFIGWLVIQSNSEKLTEIQKTHVWTQFAKHRVVTFIVKYELLWLTDSLLSPYWSDLTV